MPRDLVEFIRNFLKDGNPGAERMDVHPLRGDGSKRLFWRIFPGDAGTSLVAMANPPADLRTKRENFSYLMIGSHLHGKGIPVPKIFRFDLDKGWFLMEDLGITNLQDKASSSEDPLPIYKKVVEELFRLQTEGAKGFNPAWCCQTQSYDRTVMRRYESDYFRDAFLRDFLGLKMDWSELEAPFNHLAKRCSAWNRQFFLHRDFQSRNIMVAGERIGIIDWQGGRLGPLGYDLASLLIDPYTPLPSRTRDEVYQHYLSLFEARGTEWLEPFEKQFPYLAIQRNLQILGAFSFLSKKMKKRYFEKYIPRGLETLHRWLHRIEDPGLSPLLNLVDGIVEAKNPRHGQLPAL